MNEVKTLQRNLSLLALYTGKIDGIQGSKTEAALNEFMEHEGFNGDIGARLAAKIDTMELASCDNATCLAAAVKTLCKHIYLDNPRIWAYIMATTEHETAGAFLPVEEAFYVKDDRARERYLKSKPYYPQYARGYVGLTWDYNYIKYSDILGIDFLADSDLLLNPSISLFIIVHGMATGTFTGRSVHRYINKNGTDYVNARRVVNGTDKAEHIAKLAEKWEAYYAKN